jgi:hydrogenase nickel incorporation protein HypB
MCATCGCDSDVKVSIHRVNKPQELDLENVKFTPVPALNHISKQEKKQIVLQQDILLKNNLRAERNRGYFLAKEILALNLVSSPGSGKTSLLERTLNDLKGQENFCVIEGDQQTTNDADRIASTGVPVVQINTGKGCHLDSEMIANAIKQLDIQDRSILFIENIGNLVCPAMFDLGEQKRVVIISVTEGEDKPLKYPDMFQSSQLCIINKIDLLPYLKFSVEALKGHARKVNPNMEFIELSCTLGEGLTQWYSWLKTEKLKEQPLLV